MPMLKGLPSALYLSTTFLSAAALIGCTGLPSGPFGMNGFICSQIELATVMPLPFRSMENGVMTCALVPKPMVAPSGCGRQHVRAVELAGDDAVEQHLPIRLRLDRDVEAFVLEIAELLGDRDRRHVGELDEAELEVFLFRLERARARWTA